MRKQALTTRIEDETILLPCVIADQVVRELSRYLVVELDPGDHELAIISS